MVNLKEVRDKLKEAYRRQNKVYNDWKKKLVGTVPAHLHSPELLNSELIHRLVESVDRLLAESEQDRKTIAAMAAKLEAFEKE